MPILHIHPPRPVNHQPRLPKTDSHSLSPILSLWQTADFRFKGSHTFVSSAGIARLAVGGSII